jgi:hypothetical protein
LAGSEADGEVGFECVAGVREAQDFEHQVVDLAGEERLVGVVVVGWRGGVIVGCGLRR